MLDDYNSSTCVMKEKNTTSGMAHLCSCTEEECNDELLFSPSEYMKLTPSNEVKAAVINILYLFRPWIKWLRLKWKGSLVMNPQKIISHKFAV